MRSSFARLLRRSEMDGSAVWGWSLLAATNTNGLESSSTSTSGSSDASAAQHRCNAEHHGRRRLIHPLGPARRTARVALFPARELLASRRPLSEFARRLDSVSRDGSGEELPVRC